MSAPRFPFLDWPGPIAFAHQGGADEAPENTMAAFANAVRLGYCYVETDVQLTKDGVLIAFHDSTLDRATDGTGLIADLPWSEVQKARVGGTEPIARFEELITTFPELRINVEPKADVAVDPLVDLIRRTSSIDRICAGSFVDARSRRMRKALGTSLCTCLGRFDTARLRIGSYLGPLGPLVARTGAACAQEPVKQGRVPIADARFIALAHRMHLPVHVWTIEDAAEMHRLLDLGVDGIMTDHPSVLKEVLVQRGQWFE